MSRQLKLIPSSLVVKSAVSIGQPPECGFGLAVSLTVEVGGLSQSDAQKVVAAGHELCPYSNAIKGNVPVDIKVVVV
jgi:organic hydroperoxide reductase OsmC/OhrA